MINRFIGCMVCITAFMGALPLQAQIVIESVTFHDSTNIGYDGNNPNDQGGAVFIHVRNVGSITEMLTSENCQINGQPITTIMTEGPDAPTPGWVRVWPEQVAPGEIATWVIKSFGGTITEGATFTSLQVSADSGATASLNNVTMVTPPLRLAHVVPSQDWRKIWVFIRNDDVAPIEIDELILNDSVIGQTRFLGGPVVAPGSLVIAQVSYDEPVEVLTPYALRTAGERQTNGERVSVGSFIRISEPEYGITTWGGSPSIVEERVQKLRQLYGLTGNSWGWGSAIFNIKNTRYFYRQRILDVLDMIDSDTVDFTNVGVITTQTTPDQVGAWFIEDEPDLNYGSPTRNPRAMMNLSRAYWRLAPVNPTHVNLVSSNSAQGYALTVDHPAIDCYMQYAPRHYGSFVSQTYDIDEALDQTVNLKRVSEPLRFWMTPQGVSLGTWDTQPPPWGISIQFWAQVIGGAKGLDGFKFDDTAGSSGDPGGERTQRMVELIAQLRLIEGLLLYGDPINTVISNKPTDDLATRMIVSEDQVVVGAVNLDASHTRTFGSWGTPTKNDQTGVELNFDVPVWMPVQQVVEVTPEGFIPIAHTINGQTITITGLDVVDQRIFMAGALDTKAPDKPTGLQIISDLITGTGGFMLSWKQPFDAVGIEGYQVFRNGELIADVRTPLAKIPGPFGAESDYVVRAYDGSGNLSPLIDEPTATITRPSVLVMYE